MFLKWRGFLKGRKEEEEFPDENFSFLLPPPSLILLTNRVHYCYDRIGISLTLKRRRQLADKYLLSLGFFFLLRLVEGGRS